MSCSINKPVQTHEIDEFFGKIHVKCDYCGDVKRISANPGGMKVWCDDCKKYYGVRAIRSKNWRKKEGV